VFPEVAAAGVLAIVAAGAFGDAGVATPPRRIVVVYVVVSLVMESVT
jgi:hypothetical protein